MRSQPLGALVGTGDGAAMRSLREANASMKQFTVEPVPTPTMLPSVTWSSAARPTSALSSS
jgi:hypothetical protein